MRPSETQLLGCPWRTIDRLSCFRSCTMISNLFDIKRAATVTAPSFIQVEVFTSHATIRSANRDFSIYVVQKYKKNRHSLGDKAPFKASERNISHGHYQQTHGRGHQASLRPEEQTSWKEQGSAFESIKRILYTIQLQMFADPRSSQLRERAKAQRLASRICHQFRCLHQYKYKAQRPKEEIVDAWVAIVASKQNYSQIRANNLFKMLTKLKKYPSSSLGALEFVTGLTERADFKPKQMKFQAVSTNPLICNQV